MPTGPEGACGRGDGALVFTFASFLGGSPTHLAPKRYHLCFWPHTADEQPTQHRMSVSTFLVRSLLCTRDRNHNQAEQTEGCKEPRHRRDTQLHPGAHSALVGGCLLPCWLCCPLGGFILWQHPPHPSSSTNPASCRP